MSVNLKILYMKNELHEGFTDLYQWIPFREASLNAHLWKMSIVGVYPY